MALPSTFAQGGDLAPDPSWMGSTLAMVGYGVLAATVLVAAGWMVWRERIRGRAFHIVRQALDSSQGAVAIAGRSGRLEYVNPAFERMWELDNAEEAIGRDPVEFWAHPSKPRSVIDALLRDGAWEGEMIAESKAGRRFPVSASAQIVLDPKGRFAGMMASFLDTSQQQWAEEELGRVRAFSDTLLQTAPVLVVILDESGSVLQINAALETVTGYGEAELHGRDWIETMVPPRYRSAVRERFAGAIGGDATRGYVNPILVRDGGEREVEWSDTTLTLPGSGGQGLLAIGMDVTERTRGESMLARTRERLEEAQRIARVGSWELDLRGERLFWSSEVYRIFDLDPDTVTPSYDTFLSLVHPEDRERVDQTYWRSLRPGTRYEIVHRIQLADGRVEWVEERARTQFDGKGQPVRSAGTIQLITDRYLIQEKLRRALGEREVLLREVHHRVKNNLQLISSLLYFHGRAFGNHPDVARSFAEMGQRLRSMTLLHESLYRSDDLSQIDLLEYLRSLSRSLDSGLYTPGKAIDVRVSGDDMDVPIETALPCGMMVVELVTNAFKHAFHNADDGRVEVVLAARGGGGFSLDVRDDGAGFPADFSPEAKDTFGWQLVRSLARQIDARISLGRQGVSIEVPAEVQHGATRRGAEGGTT